MKIDFRTFSLTVIAMLCFAGNSLLCRAALLHTSIDAVSFTSIRVASGALTLWMLLKFNRARLTGSWISALALLSYAVAFSFAYRTLTTATGALLLFGAVQITMISYGIKNGERLKSWQVVGLILALSGLITVLLPGLAAPPLLGAALMICAGIAWGIYSLRGKRAGDPLSATAGNFIRAVPFALALSLMGIQHARLDSIGMSYAIASGALTSGIGYAVWYGALPKLKANSAATVQLSVPVIAALGGVLLINETPSTRLIVASIVMLGGIALVLRGGVIKP